MLIRTSVLVLLAVVTLADATEHLNKALKPIAAEDVGGVNMLDLLETHLKEGNLSAFISQAHKLKSPRRALDLDDAKVEGVMSMIRAMGEGDGPSQTAKRRVFRAFARYYKTARQSVDKLGKIVLDAEFDVFGRRSDIGEFELYVIELAKETDDFPPSTDGPESSWLKYLEGILDPNNPLDLELGRKVWRLVLMNKTRSALVQSPKRGPTPMGQHYCHTTSIPKDAGPFYQPITDKDRQDFITYLIEEMDMAALKKYVLTIITPENLKTLPKYTYHVDHDWWGPHNCENGSLLQNNKSNIKLLDATMSLMSFSGSPSKPTNPPGAANAGPLPGGQPGNAMQNARGAFGGASGLSSGSKGFSSLVDNDFKALALSYKKDTISDFSKRLCEEITDSSTNNLLKFLLFQTLHPDQSVAELLRTDFFLKACNDQIVPKKLKGQLEAFVKANQAPGAVLGDLVDQSFMNIDDILIEKEIQALVSAIQTPGTPLKSEAIKTEVAPTLFKELRPEMNNMFTRIIQAGKKFLEDKKPPTHLQNKLKANVEAIIASLPTTAYKEGMILDVLTASFKEGKFPFFEVLCPKSGKKCTDLPLKLLERFQEEVLLALDADNGKPNGNTAELLVKYRSLLSDLHSKIKAQHPTQAKSATSAGPQASEDFSPAQIVGGLPGAKKSTASAHGLNDVKGIPEDYHLDLRRALKILQGKALSPLRADLIEWRSQELLDKATAADEDLLSTLLGFAVQLKNLDMVYQIISKPGLAQSFQFTQGFQVLIASILLSLAEENCLQAPAIQLPALGIDIQPIVPLAKDNKCSKTEVDPRALPKPTVGEPPNEFLALHPEHEPSIAEDLLQVLCAKFNCPFHRIEKDYMPKIYFGRGVAPAAVPKLVPPMDGFAEQWLHSMDRLVAAEKEVAAKNRAYPLKAPLYTFFESTIEMLVKYMALDPEVAKELIAFIGQEYYG